MQLHDISLFGIFCSTCTYSQNFPANCILTYIEFTRNVSWNLREMDEPRDEQSSQESSEGSTLPLEIIMYIMKKMPNKEKTNLMQTCKVLYSYGSELLSYRSPLVLHSDQVRRDKKLDKRFFISTTFCIAWWRVPCHINNTVVSPLPSTASQHEGAWWNKILQPSENSGSSRKIHREVHLGLLGTKYHDTSRNLCDFKQNAQHQ